jgi:hypothetical protein
MILFSQVEYFSAHLPTTVSLFNYDKNRILLWFRRMIKTLKITRPSRYSCSESKNNRIELNMLVDGTIISL